jgi:hypothetical protein
MATPQNRINQPEIHLLLKRIIQQTRQGNDHGSVSFGHVSADGAVTSDVHYFKHQMEGTLLFWTRTV